MTLSPTNGIVGPGDEVNVVTVFPITTIDTTSDYDFAGAGYAPNALLDTLIQGEVQWFGSHNADFSDAIDVTVGGVTVTLDGTGNAFMKRHPTEGTKAYLTFNVPTDLATYYFKVVFTETSGIGQQSQTWIIGVSDQTPTFAIS